MASNVRSALTILALLAVLLSAFGCASDPAQPNAATPVSGNGPGWIDRPNGTYDDGGAVAIYAVGIAARNPNPAARRGAAVARGRTELARTLGTMVQAMVEDYQSTSRDFFESDDTASSVEMFSDVSRQVTDEVLLGSHQVDAWRDTTDNTEYVLMKLEFNNVIAAYRESMTESIRREATRNRIKMDKEAMEGRLDEQLGKLHASTAASLNSDFINK